MKDVYLSQIESSRPKLIAGVSLRIRAAREEQNRTVDEVRALLNLSWSEYSDLEDDDEEVQMSISLRTLLNLLGTLKLNIGYLFYNRWEESILGTLGLSAIPGLVEEYLARNKITKSEFEERVGYEMPLVLSYETILDSWNLDELASVCAELKLDWHSVLATEIAGTK